MNLPLLEELYQKYQHDSSGKVASYIPELAKANPNSFAIVACTPEGELFEVGDVDQLFTLQSNSKPFVYGMALDQHGRDFVSSRVGVEPTGDPFNSIITLDEKADVHKFVTLATKDGLVKKTAVKLYSNIRQNGIIAITLNDGDELVWGKLTSGQDDLMLITHEGKSIRFSEEEVKASNRDTKGVKGITLRKTDYVIGVETLSPTEDLSPEQSQKRHLLVVTENGMGKRTELDQYPVQKRAGMGVKVAEVTKRTGMVAAARKVTEEHQNVVISTKEGQTIKLPLD